MMVRTFHLDRVAIQIQADTSIHLVPTGYPRHSAEQHIDMHMKLWDLLGEGDVAQPGQREPFKEK